MTQLYARTPSRPIDVQVGDQVWRGSYRAYRGTLVVTCEVGESVATSIGEAPPEPAARQLLRELVERRLAHK